MPIGMNLWKTDLVRPYLYLLMHFTVEKIKPVIYGEKGQKKQLLDQLLEAVTMKACRLPAQTGDPTGIRRPKQEFEEF